MSTAPQPSAHVIDVGDASFDRDVLARSETVPVVVDFWAPWCGPCRALGPILEGLAAEGAGAFVLAKVDIDNAPETASRFGVRSVPMVAGFRDRELVAQFVGAQPEPAVRAFLAQVLPSPADELAAEGDRHASAGRADDALESFAAALALDPRHDRAVLGLARLEAAAGEVEAALERLEDLVPGPALEREVSRLAAELRTRGGGADPNALREAAEAAPADVAARLALGRALAGAGHHEDALAELIEAVRLDPEHADGAARKAVLDLFELLGADHELTTRSRRALAGALFR